VLSGEAAFVLAVLATDLALFFHGRVRPDLVALLSLSALAVGGVVTPSEAFGGFANPAVITVASVFVLSGALARTGVARLLSRQILKVARNGETRLRLSLMLAAGALSTFFVSNVGVAALLLPVAMDLSRSTGVSPSRLLLPMSYAILLGGLTTLIGTPPNILVSDALRERGLAPFTLFDYTPVGLSLLASGLAFLALAAPRLLPARSTALETRGMEPEGAGRPDELPLAERYELDQRIAAFRVPPASALHGIPVAETRLGAGLGLQIVATIRGGRARPAPGPDFRLRTGDVLLVQGPSDALAELRRGGRDALRLEEIPDRLPGSGIEIAEAGLAPGSAFAGKTLRETRFRDRLGVEVLAILREGEPRRTGLQDLPLGESDTLLLRGPASRIEALTEEGELVVSPVDHAGLYRLHERLFGLTVRPDSFLAGRTVRENRLGEGFGLRVLAILRDRATIAQPDPEEHIRSGDLLVVEGRREDVATLRGLHELEVEEPDATATRGTFPSVDGVVLAEVVLSPHSAFPGKSLRQIDFRKKYGLTVLAIWREGQPLRANLRDRPLRFGDALLVHGPRDHFRVLAREPDFLVLTEDVHDPPRRRRAPLAVATLGAVLVPVYLGWLPLAVAAVTGAALVVLLGCLSMDEAYRSVEWQAVILIGGMLPLGVALERTGAAALLAEGVLWAAGNHGPRAVLAALFVVTSALTLVVPTAALVVLLAPTVLTAAEAVGAAPHPFMMAMAMAASASFASPIAHPANVLVMGPGGYRFADYLRLGLPLTVVAFFVVIVVTPLFWPF